MWFSWVESYLFNWVLLVWLSIVFYQLFRPDGDSLSCQQQQESKQRNAAPGHKPSLKGNEGSVVTPDLCGCCGTHEL